MKRSLERGLAAFGGVLALAAVGPAAAGAQGGPPAPITLTSGYVDWGVKASFRNYIKGPIAHGSFTASDGATVNPDETFRFSFVSGTYNVITHGVVSQFDGTVQFTGHGGVLDLTISDPKVETVGNTGTLYVDARSKNMSTGQFEDFDDVAFATLDLTNSVMTPGNMTVGISPIASTLTADGATAFAGFYQAGTALDPLAISVGYAPVVPPPGPSTGGGQTPQPSPPPADPQPLPTVSATSARVTALTRPYNRKGKVALARLVCRTGPCTVEAPKRVRVEVDGKRYRPAVIAPETLEQGERGTLRIQLSKRALAALAGGEATSRLTFTVRNATQSNTQTLELTLDASGVTVG
jgi:Htaa